MRKFKGWGIAAAIAGVLLPMLLGSARADGPAAAEPLISPDEMLAVDQVRPGMKGYGRSVFEGTKIERFNVTVLGVLRKMDYDGDMILVRIDDGPPVSNGSGVSAGMSGSPIYIDGKLIGALAFAWPFAKQPVAGVTPIAQMLENYRPGASPQRPTLVRQGDLRPADGPLKLDGQTFARATVVPDRGLVPAAGTGTIYLTPVAAPIMVSGMGRDAVDELRHRLGRFSPLMFAGPGKTDLPPAERPKIEPGAAIGVQLLGGDVDATAIGTVTYVKGNHVLAFGHPMFGLGSIDMPMTTAFIHGIIPSQEVSFKMGSPVETVGHITQDRNWSIGGRMGESARTVEAEFLVSDDDRGVKRDYHVRAAVQRDTTPMLLYSSLLNAVKSVSPSTSGTTRGTVEVWPHGMPVIRRENTFSVGEHRSQLEQLFGDPMAGMPLSDLLQIMDTLENNPFGAVSVDRIKVTVNVSEKRKTAAIERAYADRKQVKPGDAVKIGVVIQPADGPKEVREFTIQVPKNIPGGKLQIGVAAGSSAERIRQAMQVGRPQAKNLPQLLSQLTEREQNNDIIIEIGEPVVGISVSGREFPNLPNVVVEVLTSANPSGIRLIRSHTRQTYPTAWVLSGAQLLTLDVEADEKDKSGPSLVPGQTGLGGIGSLLDLFRMGLSGEMSGDFGSDGVGEPGDGNLTGGDDEATRANLLQALRRLAASRGKNPSVSGPNDPSTPTFEELQKILEGSGSAASAAAADVSEPAPSHKGIARSPGVWRMSTAQDFQSGKLDGVLVSSRGELALAPAATSLLASPERFFWAQTIDHSGNLYVGGWLDGSVVRIGTDGQSRQVFAGEGEVAVTALTSDAAGNVYAATEPSGTIYCISADGKSAPLCRLPGERVWVLKQLADGLYAGTGSEGRLYRIGSDGKQTVVFSAPDRHVLALSEDNHGGLFLGTYPRGKIFHVRDGKAEPLYELPSATVSAMAADSQGNVYVGTSPRASVIRISPTGEATTLFQTKAKHVLCLSLDPSGNVYAGIGSPARLYRIAPDRAVSTLWSPQAAYLLSLARDGSGNLFATTAGPTQIVRLGATPPSNGVYLSQVLNASNSARWGVIRWTGSTDGVEIRTRSGNTAYPDATWSAWSEPYRTAAGQPLTSPPGQYLQYQVSLKGTATTSSPSLRSLELFYRTRNRSPEVTIKGPAAGETVSGATNIRWSAKDPDGDRLSYDIFLAPEGSSHWTKIGSRSGQAEGNDDGGDESLGIPPQHGANRPSLPARSRYAAAPRRTVAPATAPVRVSTPVTVAVEKPDKGPKPSARRPQPDSPATTDKPQEPGTDDASAGGSDGPEDGSSLNWNSRKVPDGRYRIKVVASDAPSNPDEAQTGEVISEVFQVDNTPPRILMSQALRLGPAPPAEIPVQDAAGYVASAEYRVDGGEWIAAAAADGIFDSPQEKIRIDLQRLPTGRHTLEVRARDAAGNEATAKTIYWLPKTGAPPRSAVGSK